MVKCINRRCNKEYSDEFKYCPYCGKTSDKTIKRNRAKSPNGQGSIAKTSDGRKNPWKVRGPAVPVRKQGKKTYARTLIGYYHTYQDAKNALDQYMRNPSDKYNITLDELHEEWKEIAYRELDQDTKNNHNSSWYKLRTLYNYKVRDIRTSHMQQIIDYYTDKHHEEGVGGELKYDKDTKEPKYRDGLSRSALSKIKCLLTMMYDYAMQNDVVNKNYAEFIKISRDKTAAPKERTRFTDIQLKIMENNIDKVDYADYIFAMCYTGHRINEFLSLTKFNIKNLSDGKKLLVGGNKTSAGTNRSVPIHSKIITIIENCLARDGETLFCDKKTGKQLKDKYFREKIYYPALEVMNLPRYTPHATRRTFSTRLSAAGAREEDIIALMGHTDYKVDKESYIVQTSETLINAIEKLI